MDGDSFKVTKQKNKGLKYKGSNRQFPAKKKLATVKHLLCKLRDTRNYIQLTKEVCFLFTSVWEITTTKHDFCVKETLPTLC